MPTMDVILKRIWLCPKRLLDHALGYLGAAYYALGQPQQAIACHEQTLALVRDLGDHQEENLTLTRLGLDYLYAGDLPNALKYNQQALEMARERGDRLRVYAQMIQLGRLYRMLGEVRQAVEYLEQALAMVRDAGARRWEGMALGFLGDVYRDIPTATLDLAFCLSPLSMRTIGTVMALLHPGD